MNDPLLDSHLSLAALANQAVALADAAPALLTAWHWLSTLNGGGAAYDTLFSHFRGQHAPSETEGQNALLDFLADRSCLAATAKVIDSTPEHPWELAYVTAWLSTVGDGSVMPPWVVHTHPTPRPRPSPRP